jgi:ATP-dependent Clp protease ATP-binding subunit ClpA
MHHWQRMFERFTEEGRQVVVLAQDEACGLRHCYVGTEHILLGLLREEEGRPADETALRALGITLTEARDKIARMVGGGDEPIVAPIPFTPRAKKVLELALREAQTLGHHWIGPEHLLLGLAREHEGVAARVLLDFGVDHSRVRNEGIRVLEGMPQRRPPVAGLGGPRTARLAIDASWVDGIETVLASLGPEIRTSLGREPDAGDLLLVIACAHDSTASQALRELGVDLDLLWSTLERIRQGRTAQREELVGLIADARRKKHVALEAGQFEEAVSFRDVERELTARLDSEQGFEREIVREARRRLGLHR